MPGLLLKYTNTKGAPMAYPEKVTDLKPSELVAYRRPPIASDQDRL